MVFIKNGESTTITAELIQQASSVQADAEILDQFSKVASGLKQIAPKADDFLYFAAIMMHAAEASLLNEDGTIKKDASGEAITCSWDKSKDTWKWICSNNDIKPYKNSNNDIFPEEELIRAHKKWVGRPLCIDHKSDSVDHVRGIIVDTYYDYPKKRVIALCALDKVNHPELARNVKTGVAACVSMGTAVGRAICTDCGKVARVEADFCNHMRNKSCYGEINLDLNPIELSIVVNGADPQAKIKHIIASAKNAIDDYENLKNKLHKNALHSMVDPEKVQEIENGLSEVMKMVEELKTKTEDVEEQAEETQEHELAEESGEAQQEGLDDQKNESEKEAFNIKQEIAKLASNINELREDLNYIHDQSEENEMTQKKAYFQGGGGVNEPTPGKPKYEKEDYQSTRDTKDKQMVGQMDTGPVDGMHPGPDSAGETEEARKKRLLRADLEERALKRAEAVEKAKNVLRNKSAYFQGGGGPNEPTPGKPKYEKEDYQTNRDKNDKQMTGASPFPDVGSVDGLYGDDLSTKQKLLRAKLNARFYKSADVKNGGLDKSKCHWKIFAGDKVILTASVDEITGGKSEALYEVVATQDFGKKIMSDIRTKGYDKAHELYKGAQAAPPAPEAAAPAAPDLPEPEDDHDEPMLDDAAGDPGDDMDARLEKLEELATELQNLVPDFREGLSHLKGEPSDELASDEELEEGLPEVSAAYSDRTKSLFDMQKKLKLAISSGMEETLDNITEHLEELNLAKNILSDGELLKGADTDKVDYLVTNATADAKETLSEAYKLMEAFVRYANGSTELEKTASAELIKFAQLVESGQKGDPLDPTLPEMGKKPPAYYTGRAKEDALKREPERNVTLDKDPLKDPVYLRARQKADRFKGLYNHRATGKVDENGFRKLNPASRLTDDEIQALYQGAWAKQGTELANTMTPEETFLLSPAGRQMLAKMVPQGKATQQGAGQPAQPRGYGGHGGRPAGFSADDADEDELDANAAKVDLGGGRSMELNPEEAKSVLSGMAGAVRDESLEKEAASACCKKGCEKCSKDGSCKCKCKEANAKTAQHNLNTKEGRMAYRAELEAKLAAKSKDWSDMLQKAHPKGGETTQLDVKPEGDLAKVERLDETHDAMMDVATAPPRIRKLASDIQKFVEAGQINPEKDFPELIRQGLDSAAVKYWKQFYGEAKDGGSQFASELVKEHHTKKAENEKAAYRVKVARAYDLAHEMVRRGLLRGERAAINEQVSDILSWSDDSFESMQRVVEMQPLNKQASAMPQVTGNSILETEGLPAPKAAEVDLVSDLNLAFANKRY